MKTIELERITDTGAAFEEVASSNFGGDGILPLMTGSIKPVVAETAPLINPLNEYDVFASKFEGVKTSQQMDEVRMLPIGQNQVHFKSMIGKFFGFAWQTGEDIAVYPGVILDKTTDDTLVMTYLGSPDDRLNPHNISPHPLQAELLRKISALQAEGTGSLASHDRTQAAIGQEFGHGVLSFAGVLQPALLAGEHKTHGWTDADGGIAGAVTDPTDPANETGLALYDIRLDDGTTRQIREKTIKLTGGFIIDHPEFHRIPSGPNGVKEFTAGLGILALNSQLGEISPSETRGAAASRVTYKILGAMQQL